MITNLIDVSHHLSIISNATLNKQVLHSNQILKSANCASSGNVGLGLASRISNSNNKSATRKSTHKPNNKAHIVYQIIDNNKIMLYRNQTAVNSYNFDYIKEMANDLSGVAEWVLRKDKRQSVKKQQLDVCSQFKIILAHNYQLSDIYGLMGALGKKLLTNSISFHIYTTLSSARQNKGRRSMSINKIKTFGQNTQCQQQKLAKNINFVSQLKQYLNQIKTLNYSIQRFWIFTSELRMGFGVYQPQKNCHAVKLINKLTNDYQIFNKGQQIPKNNNNSISYSVEISTLSQTPQQKSIQKTKRILQQAILLKHTVKCYGLQQKQSLFSFRQNQYDDIIYSQNNQPQIRNYNYSKTREPFQNTLKQSNCLNCISNNQPYKKRQQSTSNVLYSNKYDYDENHFIKTKNNIKKCQQQYLSSQQSQISQVNYKKLKKKNSVQKFKGQMKVQNALANLMAENIHLKWQFDKIQKQYEQQSQKYIQKTNKKFENLREQKSFCIQESARLRKDNEQLIEQINLLKINYEQVLASRSQYQKSLQQKYKILSQTTEDNYKQKIKQLQTQIKNLNSQKNYLQKQLMETKSAFENGRRRNRDRIEQNQQQINKYKKFSQQIKTAYDQLERQARMDKNRCQNLQKRCKKYQQSISNLLKLKNGGSVWSEQRASEYASSTSQQQIVSKAIQFVYQQGQIVGQNSEYDTNSKKSSQGFKKKQQQTTKRKKYKQRKNSEDINDKEQQNMKIKTKFQIVKQEGKKQKQRKRKKSDLEKNKKQAQPIKHFRLISFADAQK